jgi:hypothetical protein
MSDLIAAGITIKGKGVSERTKQLWVILSRSVQHLGAVIAVPPVGIVSALMSPENAGSEIYCRSGCESAASWRYYLQ